MAFGFSICDSTTHGLGGSKYVAPAVWEKHQDGSSMFKPCSSHATVSPYSVCRILLKWQGSGEK
jgi:hypothetical protein